MGNLWAFFSSFDKLMKEKLVKAFYWLVLLSIALHFIGRAFDFIGLDAIDDVLDFVEYFVNFFMFIVGFRLLAELAIALFRINDNLSPDGGKSETANIDPLEEARKAAEAAAIRARDVTKSTYEKTTAATKSTFDKSSSSNGVKTVSEPRTNPARTPNVRSAASKTTYKKAAPKKAAPKKTVTTPKTTTKPAVRKTTTAKKSAAKKTTTTRKKISGVTYNKDGSIRKRPGPKSGSSSKYTKDGRLKKKPGPKPK